MSKSLSNQAVEALWRLKEVDTGHSPPAVPTSVAAELLGAGLADEDREGHIEITCDGRKYLSCDCD